MQYFVLCVLYPALLWRWQWLCSHWLGRQPCDKRGCESQIRIPFCKYNGVKTGAWIWGPAMRTAAGLGHLSSVWPRVSSPAVWGGPVVAAVATDTLVRYLLLLMWGSYSFIFSLSGLVLKQIQWAWWSGWDIGLLKCIDSATVAL